MAPATNHKIACASEPHHPGAVTRPRVDEGGAQRQGEEGHQRQDEGGDQRQGGGGTQRQGEVQMVLSEQERKRAFDVSRMQTELFTAFMANVHEGSIRVAQPSLRNERLASWP